MDFPFTPYLFTKNAFDFLRKSEQEGRLGHANLLFGPSGSGKKNLIEAFIAKHFCEEKEPFACGFCHACRLIGSGNHPGFIQIVPQEQGHSIKIDEIRAFLSSLYQTHSQRQGKMVLIYPAEAMTEGAMNALLKGLEEPPPNTYFFLLAHSKDALLATIRSRCQSIDIRHFFDQNAITDFLKKPQTLLKTPLALSDGAPLKALTLLNNPSSEKFWEAFVLLCEGENDLVSFSSHYAEEADSLNWLSGFIEDCIRLHFGLDEAFCFYPSALSEKMEKLSNKWDLKHLFDCLELTYAMNRIKLKGLNLNKVLQFEHCLIHLLQV